MGISQSKDKKCCGNCGHFRMEGADLMRYCHNPESIHIVYELVPVEGDKPIKIPVCDGWLDCGLLAKGLLKNTV